jgi:hypothetical protein
MTIVPPPTLGTVVTGLGETAAKAGATSGRPAPPHRHGFTPAQGQARGADIMSR